MTRSWYCHEGTHISIDFVADVFYVFQCAGLSREFHQRSCALELKVRNRVKPPHLVDLHVADYPTNPLIEGVLLHVPFHHGPVLH